MSIIEGIASEALKLAKETAEENERLREVLEEVRHSLTTLMPDGWSDAPYLIDRINSVVPKPNLKGT